MEIITEEGKRSEKLSLNHPIRLGPYQIGQSRWIPDPRRPMEIVFTVATRPGLVVVWLGGAMIVAGMVIAFYVKPLLLKRRERLR